MIRLDSLLPHHYLIIILVLPLGVNTSLGENEVHDDLVLILRVRPSLTTIQIELMDPSAVIG